MYVNWKEAESAEEPKELDLTSTPGKVYMRRNITSAENDDGVTMYNYEEALLTTEQYEEYMSGLQSPETIKVMQTLTELQCAVDML